MTGDYHLELSEETVGILNGILDRLLRDAELQYVALMDEGGTVLAGRHEAAGRSGSLPAEAAGALAAGALRASQALAGMLGETAFQDQILHGDRLLIYLRGMGELGVLLAVAHAEMPVGVVRQCVVKHSEGIGTFLASIRTNTPPELPPKMPAPKEPEPEPAPGMEPERSAETPAFRESPKYVFQLG